MLEQPRRERMLNVPAIVVLLVAALGLIHALLMLALTAEQTTEVLLLFAFIPARYDAGVLPDVVWPGGWPADIWTFVSYAFIHGDISHLVFNVIWLLAFGSPVARRFGASRFMAFMAATAAAGAAVHLDDSFWGIAADGRRLGGDLRRHGCGHAVCVSAWQFARVAARPRAGRPGAGRTAG